MEAAIGQQFATEGHSKVSPCSFTGHLKKTRKDLSKCLEAAIGQQLAKEGSCQVSPCSGVESSTEARKDLASTWRQK